MRIALCPLPPWWVQGLALMAAAGLAVWLLLQPSLIQGLPLGLRFPAILLGVWALGAAFLRPVSIEPSHPLLLRALSPPWSHLALILFALLVLVRALMA